MFIKPSTRKIVVERDKACVYCGKPVDRVLGADAPYAQQWKAYDDQGYVFHFEHQIPLVAGGANDETNIVLACAKCNLEKARREQTARAYKGGEAMGRTIKVTDGVYIALEEVREKRETFSEAIERLLRVYDTIKGVSDTLGPSHYLMERPPGLKEG